jgi:hypothetical protein
MALSSASRCIAGSGRHRWLPNVQTLHGKQPTAKARPSTPLSPPVKRLLLGGDRFVNVPEFRSTEYLTELIHGLGVYQSLVAKSPMHSSQAGAPHMCNHAQAGAASVGAGVAFSGTTSFALTAGAFLGVAFFFGATFLAGALFATLSAGTFFSALIAAQRFFCASAMRLLAAALILCFLAGAASFTALTGVDLTAFFCFAHLAFTAAAISALPSGLSFRFFLPVPTGRPGFRLVVVPVMRARACRRLSISASSNATMSVMPNSVAPTMYYSGHGSKTHAVL